MNPALVRGLVLRWTLRHRLRAALGIAAVALGVAAYLASAAVARSVMLTGTAATSALAGGADLVVAADETGLPTALLGDVRGVPGVTAAAPLVTSWVRIASMPGRRAMVVGIDPLAETRMRRRAGGVDPSKNAAVADPVAFAMGGGAIVAMPLAEELGLAVGGVLHLQGAGGGRSFTVAGTFDIPGDAPRGNAGRVVLVSVGAARLLLARGDRVDRIDVTLDSGRDPGAAADAIRAALAPKAPPSLLVGPPGMADPSTGDVLGAVDVGLKLGAVVALLVGVFLIHHTVSIGVTERRREVGILRALGATRGQVLLVFCVEAVVLGLIGAALGIGLGWAVATTSLQGVASTISGTYFPSEPAPVEVSALLALSGLAVGAFVALVAAFVPARRAAGEAPNDAVRRGPEESVRGRLMPAPRAAAALVFAVATAFFVWGPDIRLRGYYAIFSLLVAFVASAPTMLVLGARAIAPLLRLVAGVPGELAAEELARRPARAALPAAALAFGLALVVETLGIVESLSKGTIEWMEENVAGDLFVSSGRTVLAGGGHTPLEASLAGTLRSVPGVETVVAVRTLRIPWNGTRVFILALDIPQFRRMTHLHVSGSDAAGAGGLRPRDAILADVETGAACLISENFSALHGTQIGDTIELPSSDGRIPLRVAGTFPDYSWPRGTVLMSRRVVEERMRDGLADQFSVMLAPGATFSDVAPRVEAAVGTGRELVVTSGPEFRAAARALLSDFFRLGYAQVAVSLSVAFLGVFNGLWIAVVLRRREIGLLRAAGATRGQVVGSIVMQAACLGAVGATFGLLGGIAVEWIALRRVLVADTGWYAQFVVPWGPLSIVVVLGVIASALAGIIPARAAVRTELRDALSYE
ncbi:MAG: FtsX-like permease family protein [Planctomycetes bacterium]|nr:FtsX-like permease family protein [Planctomycetota bacterium]